MSVITTDGSVLFVYCMLSYLSELIMHKNSIGLHLHIGHCCFITTLSTHLLTYHLTAYPIYAHRMLNDKTKRYPVWAKYVRRLTEYSAYLNTNTQYQYHLPQVQNW